MFPEALPVKAIRRCLHCQGKFKSSSAAERVCPKCRRKHSKLVDKHGGVMLFEMTPEMNSHIRRLEEDRDFAEKFSEEKIGKFLAGEDVDDSAVYVAIKKIEIKTTASDQKPEAVVLLSAIIEDITINAKDRRVRSFSW